MTAFITYTIYIDDANDYLQECTILTNINTFQEAAAIIEDYCGNDLISIDKIQLFDYPIPTFPAEMKDQLLQLLEEQ